MKALRLRKNDTIGGIRVMHVTTAVRMGKRLVIASLADGSRVEYAHDREVPTHGYRHDLYAGPTKPGWIAGGGYVRDKDTGVVSLNAGDARYPR